MARPVIALTTDFGTRDSYVAETKAVLLRHCPGAYLLDVTHEVAPWDLIAGSVVLERAARRLPELLGHAVYHLAVVDPGVGSSRRLLLARLAGSAGGDGVIVCPDNGLMTWLWRRAGTGAVGVAGNGGGIEMFEILWRPAAGVSRTFHGRDLMAPVVGMLAAGRPAEELGRPIDDPALLDLHLAAEPLASARVLYLDHYGNAVTNATGAMARRRAAPAVAVPVRARAGQGGAWRDLGPVRDHYAQVPVGEPVVLVGSHDLVEIAVRNGSAAEALGLRVGDEVLFQ